MNKTKLAKVWIDDFALKKGATYGTIMIDFDTHRIVDMIPSRDYKDVKEWLEGYTNLTLVSRDGSITYRNAITEALPKAKQVSDRFHLLKNLTSYAKEYLKKQLGVRIRIEVDDKIEISNTNIEVSKSGENRKLTLKEKYEQMISLKILGHNKTTICKTLNMDIRVYNRLITASQAELDKLFTTTLHKQHEEKVAQKISLVNEVRKLRKEGLSLRKISRHTGLHFKTVLKYIDESFNPVNASYGKKKNGNLTPFIPDIESLLTQGVVGTQIETIIREKGYIGSSSNMRHFISDWKARRKHDSDSRAKDNICFEIIERKNLFSLLFRQSEQVKSISETLLSAVFEQYPCFQKVHSLVWHFKDLLSSNDSSCLDTWISKAKSLNIREINSFVQGVIRDLDAVKNAVDLPFSNGLAEGSVNKLKVVKRVMFGRCSFDMLKAKVLQLEYFRTFN